MILADQLHLVGDRVGAQLLLIKQVHGLALSTHVELPHTEQLFSEAVNRLVCLDGAVHVWVDIVHEASNSQ